MTDDLWKKPLALRNKHAPERLVWLDADQIGETIWVREQGRTAHRETASDWEPATANETELLRRTVWDR